MWPWEHLAIGYLAYSLFVRGTERRAPAAGGAIAVTLGTQFPDLFDKTLGWIAAILPSGQSLAHSVLFAIPTILAVGMVATLVGRTHLGVAFGVGYLSHLPGDVVYPALLGGELRVAFLLWPVLESPTSQPTALFAYVQELFVTFGTTLTTPQGIYYLLFEVSLLTVALLLWIYDGAPGLPGRGRGSPGRVP